MANIDHQKRAIDTSISVLEKNNFDWIAELGSGSFGTVVELKHRLTQKVVAAKIVLEEDACDSERKLWPSLRHENVLPVIESFYLPETRTSVFLMPKLLTSIDDMLENSMFFVEGKSFKRAVSWLKGIVKGVAYLHQNQFCHLDLKTSNVLISNSDRAVLSDFGSLTRTDGPVNTYVSPFIYRAPEALITENGKRAVVDGYKYDIYTVGMLATEMFTKQRIWKSVSYREENPRWENVMYPVIFHIFEAKQFKKFVKVTFIMDKITSKSIRSLRNFIIGCASLNPQKRPSADTALQHRLFGGSKCFQAEKNDIWKAPTNKISFLISLFIARAAAFRLPTASDREMAENSKEPIDVIQSDSDVPLTQKISDWARKTKSRFANLFNRLLPTFKR